MVVLEQIKSRQSQNIQWVIKEATKIGCLRNLDEAEDCKDVVVLVAKVRDIQPVNKLNTTRNLLLKEVFKDGSYGEKFRAYLFGDVANNTESANLCIGDRLIFVQPHVVLNPGFEIPTGIHRLQVECGLQHKTNQRLILVKKKFEDGGSTGYTSITSVEKNTNQTNPTKHSEKESGTETRQENAASSTSFSKLTVGGTQFRKPQTGVIYTSIDNSVQTVSTKANYVYKKIADIKEAEYKVNVYVVVSEILKVQSGASRRKTIILKAVDETCTGKQHFVIRIMCEDADWFLKMIKPNIILRLHRMKVDYNEGVLGGIVFKETDVLIFQCNKKTVSKFLTPAKTYTFTDYDRNRANEMRCWLNEVYLPILIGRDLEWQSLNSIRPGGLFQMYCLVKDVTIHPVTKTLVLHVCDGLSCPLMIYQVPVKEEHWAEKSEYFVQNLRTVDIIVEKPTDKIRKVKKGSYIVLGPIKLRQCEVDPTDPKYYKMELIENENSIKVLDSADPAAIRIDRRLAEDKFLQENKSSTVENMVDKNNQKENVFKEKRKLYNITDNMDHSGPKRKKNDAEITKHGEANNGSKEERIKSPFEEELFNFASTVPSTAYSDQKDNKTSSGTNPSKQPMLKRKLAIHKPHYAPEINQQPCTRLLPTQDNEERQKTDKSKLLSDLKTKRIDTMSQESVDECFEKLSTMLLTKLITPRKSSSPGSEADKNSKSSPKEPTNNDENKVELEDSSSSSSVVLVDPVNETSDKTKCQTPSISTNENKLEELGENIVVLKLVQLPPGKKSRVVVKDNEVLFEMDHKGIADDAKQITLWSLLEEQLGKKLTTTKNGDSTIPKSIGKQDNTTDKEDKLMSEEDGMRKKSILGKVNKQINECRTKQQTIDISLTDRFKLNELNTKKLPSEKNSNVTKTTYNRNCTNVSGHSKQNLLKSKYPKASDSVDLCDANTIINEKVNKDITKISCDVVSIGSSEATTIKNPELKEQEDQEMLLENDQTNSSYISSVKDWLNRMDFSPNPEEEVSYRVNSPSQYINPMVNPEALTKDMYLFDHKVIRTMVYVLDVEPAFFQEEPMDLTSGFCFNGCHEMFLNSTLLQVGTEAVCPKCHASGKTKVVQMMFALRMKVLDPAGKILTVLLFKQYAEKFFGCSISSYIHNLEKRKRITNLLLDLKLDNKKTFLCPINVCITKVDSQNFITDTRIYYKT